LHNHNSHPAHPRTDGNAAQVEEIIEAKATLDRTLIPESENGCKWKSQFLLWQNF
jgi:hypothetical protein